MRLRLEDKQKALKLRIEGKSYREIINVIPNLSKGTLSGWLSRLKLTPVQQKRLEHRLRDINYNAKTKSAWTKKEEKRKRIKKYYEEAKRDYPILIKNRLFFIGLALYWAEGSKKTQEFQFTNSDPYAVMAIIKWLTRILKISKDRIKIRLYIHKTYAHENCEKFWSTFTGIKLEDLQKTVYKPTQYRLKRNMDYKGCAQLRVLKSSNIFWKIMAWIDLLKKDFDLRPRSSIGQSVPLRTGRFGGSNPSGDTS